MLGGVTYLELKGNEELLDNYFYILLRWRGSKAIEALKKFCEKRGNAVNEEMRCSFSDEWSIYDDEYLDIKGVVFYFDYPAVNEDCAVVLSYKQFYDIVEEKFKKYTGDSNDINEIFELLHKLKNVLQVV